MGLVSSYAAPSCRRLPDVVHVGVLVEDRVGRRVRQVWKSGVAVVERMSLTPLLHA